MSRHARRSLRTPVLLLLVLVVLNVAAYVIAHAALLLVLGAALTVLVVRCARHRAPGPRDRAEPADVTRMRAQLDQAHAELGSAHRQVTKLERELADAEEGMHRAWDQAASVTPRPAPGPEADSAQQRLLNAPRSGVRPLFGGDR